MDKSYVTLCQRICCKCGKEYDTGELALDTRLRDLFNKYTVIGFGICDKCKEELIENKYVLLCVMNESMTEVGKCAIITEEGFNKIFKNEKIPEDRLGRVDQKLMDLL